MNTKRFLLLLAISCTILTLVFFSRNRRGKTPPAAPTSASTTTEGIRVRTLAVEPQSLEETITATGTIRADESIDVRPEISGKLMKIHFQEGGFVRTGTLLITINDAELRASLQRAIYRRELADLKTRRLSQLRNQGGVTQQEYDIAASELSVLNAEVAVIEAQLEHTEIRAPFDGVVGLRSVSEGAYVTPATRIATFQRLDRLKVDFNIPEKYAYRINPVGEVRVTAADGSPPLTGQVHAIEPLVDAATRTVQVRAVCANPAGRHFSGGFVRVTLSLNRIPDAILVPSQALAPGATDQGVYVVDNGLARRRVVRTGTRTNAAVQILEGLRAGDVLIVSNLQQMRPGLAVRPAHEEAHPAATLPVAKRVGHAAATAGLN